jgi:hypothetical protein
MNKNLAAIVIAATLSWGVAHAQTSEPNKLNFSLSPRANSSYLDINSRPELKRYIKMQECLRKMGENYDLMLAPVGNKSAFLPDITYPVSTAKPEPDNKFMIKPWNWSKEFKLKNDYGKKSQGILIFEHE